MIVVRKAGPLTTVQDAGRPGWAHLGVPRAGAVDEVSFRRANALVGNPPGTAALEATLLGPVLEFDTATRVAVVGVDRSELRAVAAGETLAVGPVRRGVRVYVAVAGGIDVPPVLGSRSADTLSGVGPPALRSGDVLPVGTATGAAEEPPAGLALPGEPTLRVQLGPRDDWFATDAVQVLTSAAFVVSRDSDRTGVRLDGPPLARQRTQELPSEGLVAGAVQVPPDGRPIVFLANHPTTGGYPVIGVVVRADVPLLAQCRPGTTVRFGLTTAS